MLQTLPFLADPNQILEGWKSLQPSHMMNFRGRAVPHPVRSGDLKMMIKKKW